MLNPIKYHETIKNEQHVFLCCVSGRSSSTAFQRILNSSNKVWIWGEPHGVMKKLFGVITHTKKVNANERVKKALNTMYLSYVENKHTSFYPNAVGNLETTTESMNYVISNFLKPWAPKVKRFGFKEIDSMPIALLSHLKSTYPQSFIVFCFRNPLKQWPSLCRLELSVSYDLDYFLEEYEKMARHYLYFARKSKIKAFVESTDLRDIDKINHIIKYLNIPEIDNSLIDLTVHSIKPKRLARRDIDKILNSTAYQYYLKMQKQSQSFFKMKLI